MIIIEQIYNKEVCLGIKCMDRNKENVFSNKDLNSGISKIFQDINLV
jgi:hypothetical protein